VRPPARGRRGARAPGRGALPRRSAGDRGSARRLRRHGRAALLLRAEPAARGAGTPLLRLVRGQRHLPERGVASRRGRGRPSRPPPRGDRQPLPRSPAGTRPPQRARLPGAHRRPARRPARRGRLRADRAAGRERARGVPAPGRRAVSVVPKKALGQHFLVDENILGVIGRLASLQPEDVVLEVGPGLGVLTRYLADRVALVHAVELDRSLEPGLRAALAGRPNVRLVFADALGLDRAALDPQPGKLVANLPYN